MARFRVHMEEDSAEFHVQLGEYVESGWYGPTYDGEYTVTPKISQITLETSGKIMGDDVVVLSIPRYDTSNPSGGTTVYIGGE